MPPICLDHWSLWLVGSEKGGCVSSPSMPVYLRRAQDGAMLLHVTGSGAAIPVQYQWAAAQYILEIHMRSDGKMRQQQAAHVKTTMTMTPAYQQPNISTSGKA